jgi:hypothetical protein
MQEDIIERLWENSSHGTEEKDIKSAWNAALDFAAKRLDTLELDDNSIKHAVLILEDSKAI